MVGFAPVLRVGWPGHRHWGLRSPISDTYCGTDEAQRGKAETSGGKADGAAELPGEGVGEEETRVRERELGGENRRLGVGVTGPA